MDIPFLKVSRAQPVLTVTLRGGLPVEIDTADLIISRVGDNIPFAAYGFTSVSGDHMTRVLKFQFDELLFARYNGRYQAQLIVNGVRKEVFYFQYEPNESISIRAG